MTKDYWILLASLKDTGFDIHISEQLPFDNILPQINYLGIFASNSINDVTGPVTFYNLLEYQCLMFSFEIKDMAVTDPRMVKNNYLVTAFVLILFKNTQKHQQYFANMRLLLLDKVTLWRQNYSRIREIQESDFEKLTNILTNLESIDSKLNTETPSIEYNKLFFIDQLNNFSSIIDKHYSVLFVINSEKYFEEISNIFINFGQHIFPKMEKNFDSFNVTTIDNLEVKLVATNSLKKMKNKSVMLLLDTDTEFESYIQNIDKLELEDRENCLVYLYSEKGEKNLVKKYFNTIYKIKTCNVGFVEEVDDSSWLQQLIQFMYRVVFKFRYYDKEQALKFNM